MKTISMHGVISRIYHYLKNIEQDGEKYYFLLKEEGEVWLDTHNYSNK